MDNFINYLTVKSLPQIDFAHSFSADSYTTLIPKRENCVEISVICEGKLDFQQGDCSFSAKRMDLTCNFHQENLNISTTEYHEHKTVCFYLPMDFFKVKQEECLSIPLHISAEKLNESRVYKLIDEIIYSHTVSKDSHLLCGGLFLQLLHELNECSKETANKKLFSNLLYVKKAKKYIFAHLTQPIKQTDVAKHLGITPEYLCAIFKNAEGVSLIAYVNKIKLEKIRKLIQKEHFKLWQASEMYGYTDPNYVSRLYKKYFGINITDVEKTAFHF